MKITGVSIRLTATYYNLEGPRATAAVVVTQTYLPVQHQFHVYWTKACDIAADMVTSIVLR